jgi:S-adenosylmethionine synthetase
MSKIVISSHLQKKKSVIEFIERKGFGHPDTLSDALAERLSANYSRYTLEKFGAILHHNFDKVGLLGGSSFVKFGDGRMVSPIRVLLNGRASFKFGLVKIPVDQMLVDWTKEFMKEKLPLLDVEKDLEFHNNLSSKSSPGKTDEKVAEKGTRKYWFEPRNLADIQETKKLLSNDTSLGVGFYPLSILEEFVLDMEKKLNFVYCKDNPWIGSDIKILAFNNNNEYDITMCVPQIANYVKDAEEYKKNLEKVREYILLIAKDHNIKNISLSINTRDNFELNELYLTAIGTSVESGDEGLVGRGNRINGLITPMRPMSMEGASGKNPVYHIGKIYYILANNIAKNIFDKYRFYNEVYVASQSGRDLLDPWIVTVFLPEGFDDKKGVEEIIKKEIDNIPNITNLIIKETIKVY